MISCNLDQLIYRFTFGASCISFLCTDPVYMQMERVCENTTSADFRQKLSNFVPVIRSGDWSDIGGRQYMEDTHVCIPDLAKNFGFPSLDNEVVSFYGVNTCRLTDFYFTFPSLIDQSYCQTCTSISSLC